MHQLPIRLGFHPYLRQQVLFQIQCQRLGIVAVRLLHRLADHLELVRVDHHYPPHSSYHRIVEARRCPIVCILQTACDANPLPDNVSFSSLLVVCSGVDPALRRSPHSHPSSYWPYGDASIAGLTNLCVEVLPPHCTCPACNLSAPVIPPGAYRLRTDILFMPSLWLAGPTPSQRSAISAGDLSCWPGRIP